MKSTIIPGGKGTNIYNRFMKWPHRFSSILGITVFLNLVFYTSFAISNCVRSLALVLFLNFLSAIFATLLSMFIQFYSRHVMVRKRIWLWGRYKFDSWEELTDFWFETPAVELERISGLKD